MDTTQVLILNFCSKNKQTSLSKIKEELNFPTNTIINTINNLTKCNYLTKLKPKGKKNENLYKITDKGKNHLKSLPFL